MIVFKLIFIFISTFIVSNAFFVTPMDGIGIGGHFMNQKWNFLENKFNNKPIGLDVMKQKFEANKQDKESTQSNTVDGSNGFLHSKLWFLENKFKGPKFDFIKQKIEAKQQAKENGEKIATNTDNHSISKRSTKDNSDGAIIGGPAFGAAIGAYFLNQKLAFIQNKLKNIPVDIDAVKEKTETKEGVKKSEGQNNNIKEKLLVFLNFLKEFQAEKIESNHNVAKRSIQNEGDIFFKDGTDASNIFDGVLDGLYGALNTALKSMVDGVLVNLNDATSGILGSNLENLQLFLYGVIDQIFPSTTTTYSSPFTIL